MMPRRQPSSSSSSSSSISSINSSSATRVNDNADDSGRPATRSRWRREQHRTSALSGDSQTRSADDDDDERQDVKQTDQLTYVPLTQTLRKVLPEPLGPEGGADLRYISPQADKVKSE